MRLPRLGWRIVHVSPSGNRFTDVHPHRFWFRSSAALEMARIEPLPGWTMEVVRSD